MNQIPNIFGNMTSGLGMNNGANAGGPFGNMMNLMQMFNQFRNNPIGALMSMGCNIPQRYQSDPEAMVNYLRSSGQMNDQQFNQFASFAQQFQNGMMHR